MLRIFAILSTLFLIVPMEARALTFDTTHKGTLLLQDGRLEARFHNQGQTTVSIVIGRGTPDYRVDLGQGIELQAGFICPFEYVHDCFHAEVMTLKPGEAKTHLFEQAPPEALKNVLVSRKVHTFVYHTISTERIP